MNEARLRHSKPRWALRGLWNCGKVYADVYDELTEHGMPFYHALVA